MYGISYHSDLFYIMFNLARLYYGNGQLGT